jgi:hypothetical protein
MSVNSADLVIIGGGLGGCAAALAATRMGCRVIMAEQYSWIGGQLTSQAVPPDEHAWIETYGRTSSYGALRDLIRDYYRANYPLRPEVASNPIFNPGQGWVSGLCCEPKSALFGVLTLLQPAIESGLLDIRTGWIPVHAETNGGHATSVTIRQIETGLEQDLTAPYFLDATELGDLLPLAGVETITGAEAASAYGELHAPTLADPGNVQALTWCFPMGFDRSPGADHTIPKPTAYDFWRAYTPKLAPVSWPGRLLDLAYTNPITGEPRSLWVTPAESIRIEPDLFTYRRILSGAQMQPGSEIDDVTLVNWPQNDYLLRDVTSLSRAEREAAFDQAKELSLSLLYWMQTEMPRIDGNGLGYPGLMLRPDVSGTPDGLAMAPYIRESRRIKAVFTVTEEHVGAQMRRTLGLETAESFDDSIGVGCYRIDLHPSTSGDNYIDIESFPFEIPLGALLPVRIANILPACKNIGTTHITNGCYRLHPVEWNIGESAGYLAAWCVKTGSRPHQVRESPRLLAEFQALIQAQGIEIRWPEAVG